MIETQAPPRCDGNATGRIAGEWGMEAIPCQVRRGLRSFTDGRGTERYYCPAHESNVERRFGRPYVSEIADDPLGQAKAIERIVDLADVDEDAEFDREGQPEFNGAFR